MQIVYSRKLKRARTLGSTKRHIYAALTATPPPPQGTENEHTLAALKATAAECQRTSGMKVVGSRRGQSILCGHCNLTIEHPPPPPAPAHGALRDSLLFGRVPLRV